MQQDEDQLMARTCQGDKAAFETLVIMHRPGAVRFAESLLKDASQAEDVVQDCLARIYLNRESYSPRGTFKCFLFTAVRNRCTDLHRSCASRMAVELDEEEWLSMSDGRSLEENLSRKEDRRAITQAFSSLKADYQTVLYLFAVEGLHYAEIAQVIHKTVPQVKIQLSRARKKLRLAMERGEEG